MLPVDTQTEFIRLRAEGLSYRKICDQLAISKSTCSTWEQKYKNEIAELKAEQLTSLYNEYSMTREARIKKLGNTLERIDEALDNIDFTEVPPEKLLDYKLKYTEALQELYIPTAQPIAFNKDNANPQEILNILADLINRVRAGEITDGQARREGVAITNLLKAYETLEVRAKVEFLGALIDARSFEQIR